jgi:hypothetical protein
MSAEPGAVSPAVRLLTITLSGESDMAAKTLRNSLTAEQLRAALIYDPATGILRVDKLESLNTPTEREQHSYQINEHQRV